MTRKVKCQFVALNFTTDDKGNAIQTKEYLKRFWTDYILPTSHKEVEGLYGANEKITMKTMTYDKINHNDLFLANGQVYRVEKKLAQPNGLSILFLEVMDEWSV